MDDAISQAHDARGFNPGEVSNPPICKNASPPVGKVTSVWDHHQRAATEENECQADDKPPATVVVFREQAWVSPGVPVVDLSLTNAMHCDRLTGGAEVSECSTPTLAPSPYQATSSSVTSSTTSFRLLPRTRPSVSSTQGRKRNAQCLTSDSSSPSANSLSREARTMTTPDRGVRKAQGGPTSDFSKSPSSFHVPISSPCFESAMGSLSIRSPRMQISPMDFAGSSANSMTSGGLARSRVIPARSTLGSSFITYPSPTGGTTSCIRPRSSSSGSHSSSMPHAFSPASSARSSPRIAPLTVLSRPGCTSEGSTPQTRPPLHGRPTGMLLSLEVTTQNVMAVAGNKGATAPDTPSKPAASSVTTGSRSPDEISSTPERSGWAVAMSPHSRSYSIRTPQTPGDKSMQSAFDTPLPRLKLTPRATPEKELDHGLRQADFVDPPTVSAQREAPTFVNRPLSYLPIPDWCMDAPVVRHHQSPSTSFGALDWFAPPGKATSVLGPEADRNFLREMASEQARAAAMDADGSLSDPDEDDPFVLADPATLAQERIPTGPARQRPRLSYSSLEQHTLRHSGTSNSLAHTHASNTSLLGIDFVRNDSAVSLSRQALTGSGRVHAFVGNTEGPLSAVADGGGLNQGHRTLSDGSLGSIGLALEQSNDFQVTDDTRDFSTPPPILHHTSTLPLSRPQLPCAHQNIRISGSSAAAIDQTIAMMARETKPRHYHLSPPQQSVMVDHRT